MAVTRKAQVIIMTAAADAVAGEMMLQGISLDHSAAANMVLQNTAGIEIARIHTTTTELTKEIMFPKGLIVEGILAQTLSAGVLTIYLMP
jgi:hypothetical protein